jgi:glycosyltransferase involved in cell wall biosynthesis
MKTLDFFTENETNFRRRWDRKMVNNLYMFTSKHHYEPGRKNIAILNSYMETYGGGEKLSGYMAQSLEHDNNVDIIIRIPNRVTKKTIKANTGIELRSTEIISTLSGEPIKYISDYDIFINSEWCSSEVGSGKYNILMVMFPDNTCDMKVIDTYDEIFTISEFSQKWVKRYWDRDAKIIYPPVDKICKEEEWATLQKKNYILSVGRFFVGGHNKKHDIMIEAFKKLVDTHSKFKDWELHLAGALKQYKPDVEYFEMLKDMATGYNVVFHTNIEQADIHNLYKSSKIYWHATGYGESNPLKFEHFGIAPVEAIYANCVPILINKGGLPEIVNECGGFLWNSIDELVAITSDSYSGIKLKYPEKFSSDNFINKIRSNI